MLTRPMLAQTYNPSYVRYPVYVQPKLRGIRAMYDSSVGFYSRDLKRFSPPVVAHITEQMKLLPSFYNYDGEFYIHGWTEQRINGAIGVGRKEPNTDSLEVEYHIYDIVRRDLPFGTRVRVLNELLNAFDCLYTNRSGSVRFVETELIKDQTELMLQLGRYLEMGYEGLMIRLPNYAYCPGNSKSTGRCWGLQKLKPRQDAEFAIIGFQEGKRHRYSGKYLNTLGAIKCCTKDGKVFTASGMTDKERDIVWQNPAFFLGKECKIEFEKMSPDGIPLKPVCVLLPDYSSLL